MCRGRVVLTPLSCQFGYKYYHHVSMIARMSTYVSSSNVVVLRIAHSLFNGRLGCYLGGICCNLKQNL